MIDRTYSECMIEYQNTADDLPAGDGLNRVLARFSWERLGYAVIQVGGRDWRAVDTHKAIKESVVMAGFGNREAAELYLDNIYLQDYSDDVSLAFKLMGNFSGLQITHKDDLWAVGNLEPCRVSGATLALALCRYIVKLDRI